jgi:hypothetical protein
MNGDAEQGDPGNQNAIGWIPKDGIEIESHGECENCSTAAYADNLSLVLEQAKP